MSTLRARDLSVRRGGSPVLDGVEVEVGGGELVGLIGPNGSGKTTLLRALIGALARTSGSVELDGEPIDRLSPRERARRITLVGSGGVGDFPLTVRELVSLGRLAHAASTVDRKQVDAALADTAVLALAGRAVGSLSAGELQRVHLARAFAQASPLLLLDEPTANLDPRHGLETLSLVAGFVERGGGALVALHDLGVVARRCTRVIVLHCGRVRADGPPAHVLDEALIAAVFGVSARVERGHGGRIEAVTLLELSPGTGLRRAEVRA